MPVTLDEAISNFRDHTGDAKYIAGGTELMHGIKAGKMRPQCLISLRHIKELSQITSKEGKFRIGAMVTHRDLELATSLKGKFDGLVDAVSNIGTVQIRNVATIGGNLCNASPAADSAPPLLVLDSRVTLAGVDESRSLPIEEFFKGVNKTILTDNELLAEIVVPYPDEGSGSAFMKNIRAGADISKINCAVLVKRRDDICETCRIAFGSVAPTPIRIKTVEAFLKGKKVDEALIRSAGEMASEEIKPITDIRSTAEYRKDVSKVIFRDVFYKAWKRAGGDSSK
ncbi:MAG: xanthine dehydrogenase family protein subunit M, partial [Deltaproteobacteria bacterium]|nr:xanthine dehydrogenase family protein subunit M [Deltaproteobacteria bacterium]